MVVDRHVGAVAEVGERLLELGTSGPSVMPCARSRQNGRVAAHGDHRAAVDLVQRLADGDDRAGAGSQVTVPLPPGRSTSSP